MDWRGRVVLAAVCLVYLVSQNSGSRNIALATGALAGAVILLGIEFTIDRSKPEIRQWKYSLNQGLRSTRELDASGKFAATHPGQFNGDREKLTQDMVIFSLLSYLGVEQFDWQMKRTRFAGQSTGTSTLTLAGSKPDECTAITKDQLRGMLLTVGNFFADGNMFFGRSSMCLPPRSTIQVRADGLTLTNPFCEISFILEPSGEILATRPGTSGLEQPLLPNGEPIFETGLTGIRVTVRYSAIRSQHRGMPKYQDWSTRVVSGAQSWFMDSSGG